MQGAIKIKSLIDQVYDHLSNSIIEGIIRPGEKLVENDLSSQFGISRSPIRECFRILEAEGLVVISPRKGVFVRELSPKDIEDVFHVRATLEGLAATLAVPNIGQKEIKIFDDLITEMQKALDKNDIKSFLYYNFTFHSVFIKLANNQVLEKTLKNLGRGIWLRIAFLYYRSPSGLYISNRMHKDIVKAFQEKDGLSARRLVEEHMEHAKQELIADFKKMERLRESVEDHDNSPPHFNDAAPGS